MPSRLILIQSELKYTEKHIKHIYKTLLYIQKIPWRYNWNSASPNKHNVGVQVIVVTRQITFSKVTPGSLVFFFLATSLNGHCYGVFPQG